MTSRFWAGLESGLTGRFRYIAWMKSAYRLDETPIQSCRQSVSAPRRKAGVRLNAHAELRVKLQCSAREAMYRNRPIKPVGRTASPCWSAAGDDALLELTDYCNRKLLYLNTTAKDDNEFKEKTAKDLVDMKPSVGLCRLTPC